MNNQNLIQLIRESIQNYISEIDHAGENAACEAKINAIGEAITLREKKMNMDGLDEAYHDMLDKGKMKELASEIKVLKKSLAKYEKQLEKLKSKGTKSIKVEDAEEKEIVDEASLNEGVTDFPFTSEEDIKDAWGEIYDNIVDNMSSLEKFKITEPTNFSDPVKDYKFDFPDRGVPKIGEKADDVFLTKYGMSYMDAFNQLQNDMGEDKDEDEETDYWNDGDMDPAGGYGPSSHMEEDMNIQEVLYMQKIAGIITEDEFIAKLEEAKKKPSAGMTKKEKSAVAKKAHAGKDIGKKGKDFEKIEKAAGGGEKGKKIAAAVMWKSEAKKAKNLKEEVLALFKDEILNESVFFLNDAGVNLLMDKGKYMTKPGSSTGVYVVYDLSKPKGKSSFGDDDEAQKVGVWFSKDTKRPNQLETEDENMIKIFKDDKYNVKK